MNGKYGSRVRQAVAIVNAFLKTEDESKDETEDVAALSSGI